MKKCERAIAYLKPDLSDEPGNADVLLSHDDSPVLKSLGNGLLVMYLVDQGDQFEYIQNRDLEEDNISQGELHRYGLQNVGKIARDNLRVEQTEGIFVALLDGNFEASLLLLDALWEQGLARLVENDFVACIPTRDVLAFCDSESLEGLAMLKTIIERVSDGDHQLAKDLFRRIDGKWVRINA